ncbi:MAG: valine--tRNA ligase [Thermoplasmatales archaeon]
MPYDFKESERRWSEYWKNERTFRFDFHSSKRVFSIDTPPRYASGRMHIGHAFHYSHIDMIAKFHRLKGEDVFFPLCFDVNGMPIEVNVEKKYKIRMKDYDRQEFVKLCEDFADKNINDMIDQFRALGISADDSLYYRTSSEMYRKYTQISFIRMYRDGLAYKGKHPVNWCPRCETAIAESEIVYEEREVSLNQITFRGDGFNITISTTRPELIPGCVALAVNPKDERYKNLIGKEVNVPLFNKKVTILGDEDVLMDFGTGAEMICSVGDKDDLKMIYRHSLPLIKTIDETGRLTEVAGSYSGLTTKEARERILTDLKEEGYFVSESKIMQNVGTCWRCSTPLEFLQKEQWFIKTISFKDEVKRWASQISWYPDFMKKRLDDWTDSLSWDWVVSRQRYFATPIPVWECDNGHVTVAEEKQCYVDPMIDPPPVERCAVCGGELKGSQEVFDTWMDSSISPLFNTFYARDESLFEKLYPMSLRPQGQEIIRTWAYYSIVRSNLLTGRNPWNEIMVDGNIMAPDGRPMHASWGNVVDPIELIGKYGADAFRYFAASCSLGEDSPFRERDLIRGQRFVNKIFNLVNFLEFYKGKQVSDGEARPADHWIRRELNRVASEVDSAMSSYAMDKAIRSLENFIWHTLADDYVEIVKHRLLEKEAYENVYHVILSSVIMVSPILPFIAEDSYQRFFRKYEEKNSIFDMPFHSRIEYDEELADIGALTVKAVSLGRDLKVKQRIPLSEKLGNISIISPGEIEIDKEDVKGALRSETISEEKGSVEEKIISVKLKPEMYQLLKGKAKEVEKAITENPQLIEEGIEIDGIKISREGIIVVKEYSVQGRSANCSGEFCISIRK